MLFRSLWKDTYEAVNTFIALADWSAGAYGILYENLATYLEGFYDGYRSHRGYLSDHKVEVTRRIRDLAGAAGDRILRRLLMNNAELARTVNNIQAGIVADLVEHGWNPPPTAPKPKQPPSGAIEGAQAISKAGQAPLAMLTAEKQEFAKASERRLKRFAAAYRELKGKAFADIADVQRRERLLADAAFVLMDLQESVDELSAAHAAEGITKFSLSDILRGMFSFKGVKSDKDKVAVFSRWRNGVGFNNTTDYDRFHIARGAR